MDNKAINFDELFKLYYRALCIYATHYLHNIDIAEDIVQECFSTLWEESVQKHKEIINIRAYLYTMVRNSSLDHLRKESVSTKISPLPTSKKHLPMKRRKNALSPKPSYGPP